MKEMELNVMKRVEANDPVAMCHKGKMCNIDGDYDGALNICRRQLDWAMWKRIILSVMYDEGQGVQKDEKKRVHHLEQAAIGGHPEARYNLGCAEADSDSNERAMKHWIIAANLGDDDTLKNVKRGYKNGLVSKEDFASALRAHQAAIDATQSPKGRQPQKMDEDDE